MPRERQCPPTLRSPGLAKAGPRRTLSGRIAAVVARVRELQEELTSLEAEAKRKEKHNAA